MDDWHVELLLAEARLREMLPWDAGDSRLWLWASAFAAFALVVVVPALSIGALAGRITDYVVRRRR